MKWKTIRVCDTMKEAREVLNECEIASKGGGAYEPTNGLEVKIRIKNMPHGKYGIQFYLPDEFDFLTEQL